MALQEMSEDKTPIRSFRKRKVVDYGEKDDSFDIKLEVSSTEEEDDDDNWSVSVKSETDIKKQKNTISNIKFPPIDFEEDEMSEYEKQRLRNVEENKKMMLELGILQKNNIVEVHKSLDKKPVRPKPAKTKAVTPLPTKRSLRLQGKTPLVDVVNIFTPTMNDTPRDDDTKIKRMVEGELSMAEDDSCVDMLDKLRNTLSSSSGSLNIPSAAVDVDRLIDDMRGLHLAKLQTKVCSKRIQSLCVHPMESKLLVIAGSTAGYLGIWDVASDSGLAEYNPHVSPINCISVSSTNHSKLYTTSHDGTIRRADIQKGSFDLVYQTNEDNFPSHLTWHCELDEHNLLVAHGNGLVGVVDQRISQENSLTRSYECHARSVRTVQLHPVQPQYFLTSSGTGECKVFDIRQQKNNDGICNLAKTNSKEKKGMTSAFFSPDGSKVLTTCNSDRLRIFDVSNFDTPKVRHEIVHDNHTGRWLSVFKAKWHPTSSDIFFIGSMQYPKRIQIYNGSGVLMRQMKNEDMTTICPVLDIHPTQSIVAGGDSVGRVYIFTTKTCRDRLNL